MGELSENPAPPKRHRRRIIVVFVLVLMSMVSWWHWPRGDARFVGKWKMVRTDRTAIGQHDLVLNRNGTGCFREQDGTLGHFRWSFEDDRLCIGWLGDGVVGRTLHQLAIKLNRAFGVSFHIYRSKYRVSNVTHQSFDMELDREGAFGHPLDRHYERLPE